jgi:hypothetical protein
MKDLGWSVRAVLADAQFRLGRLRYAKSYDLESIEILRELRRQFGSEDAWRRFLKVPSRAALYGGIARRLQARYTLAEAP